MISDWELPREQVSFLFRVDTVLAEVDGPSIATFVVDEQILFGVAADEDDRWVRWIIAPVERNELIQLAQRRMPTRDIFRRSDVWVVDKERFSSEKRIWLLPNILIPEDALPDSEAFLPRISCSLLARRLGTTAVFVTQGPVMGDRGADAEIAGLTLYGYARLLKARSQNRVRSSGQTPETPTEGVGQVSGPVVLSNTRPYQAAVTRSLHGSFGFEIEDLSAMQDTNLDLGAVEDVRSIIKQVGSDKEEESIEAIGALDRNSRAALKDLVKTLAKSKAGLRVIDPMLHSKTDRSESIALSGVNELTVETVRKIADRIQHTFEEEAFSVRRGIIVALMRQPRRYEFIVGENLSETIVPEYGPVDASLTDGDITLIRSFQNVPLDAQFRVVKLTTGARTKTIHALIGVVVKGQLIGNRADEPDEPYELTDSSDDETFDEEDR